MTTAEEVRRWVAAWEEAAPKLEAIRREEIRRTDTLETLAALEGAFNHALRTRPMRPSSGMVEMQAAFAKLRS